MSAPYPWLTGAWRHLTEALANDRLGHAYLLDGPPGLGKFDCARAFATLALCSAAADDTACGECRACHLLAAGAHPDLRLVVTEEDRKSIVIDQVRDLGEFHALKPHYGQRKISIIHPADSMGSAAANALLKLLEEPPAGALLVLVANRAGRLPATIRSRCQRIRIDLPDWPARLAWLQAERGAAGEGEVDPETRTLAGAPLELRDQMNAQDGTVCDHLLDVLHEVATGTLAPLEAMPRVAGDDIRAVLDAAELVMRAVAQTKVGVAPRQVRPGRVARDHLQRMANHLNSRQVFAFDDKIAEARTAVQRSAGIRGSEVLESLLIDWARITRTENTA